MSDKPRARRRRLRVCLPACLSWGLISSAAAQEPPAVPDEDASGIEVEIANGLLTLHAEGAPLAEVLRAIGEAGAFEVVLRGAFAEPVRASIQAQPLEKAVRRLAEGHSVVILHGDPGPASGAAALAKLRVIENPTRVRAREAVADEPKPVEAEVALEEHPEPPPMDRETFRLANLGAAPPSREDILLDLADADQAMRVAAVPRVMALGPRAAIGLLSGVLAEEEDPLVRSRAIAALTRVDRHGAWRVLRGRALEDDDPALRLQALNALAASAGERATGVLGQALRRDSEPDVRIGALRALQRVGKHKGRSYVEQAAADPDPKIGAAAEQALAAWPAPEE